MNAVADKVAALVRTLTGTHERESPPDVDQRAAAWWWGSNDEDMGWSVAMAQRLGSSAGEAVYFARVADDSSRYRALKEWAYRTAVDFVGARKSDQRRRSLVESYRADWGHQAARDGLARALWPELVDEMPGRNKRAEQFRCGGQAYFRVREEVRSSALDLFLAYRCDLDNLLANRWTRDMIERWEQATGAIWTGNPG